MMTHRYINEGLFAGRESQLLTEASGGDLQKSIGEISYGM